MPFLAREYDIEDWLEAEDNNLLQKVCNIFDDDGFLVARYKTRVNIVPVGNYAPNRGHQVSTVAPSLFRAFSYDDEGGLIASIPEMREWTQDCEDAAQGALPGDPGNTGVPAGLKVAKSLYDKGSAAVAQAATEVIVSKTLALDESIYLRHAQFDGPNRALYRVKVDGVDIGGTKRTWWGRFSDDSWFSTADGGILYEDEEVITIEATNKGKTLETFNCAIGYVIK